LKEELRATRSSWRVPGSFTHSWFMVAIVLSSLSHLSLGSLTIYGGGERSFRDECDWEFVSCNQFFWWQVFFFK
jgi:hypothetical protein